MGESLPFFIAIFLSKLLVLFDKTAYRKTMYLPYKWIRRESLKWDIADFKRRIKINFSFTHVYVL